MQPSHCVCFGGIFEREETEVVVSFFVHFKILVHFVKPANPREIDFRMNMEAG